MKTRHAIAVTVAAGWLGVAGCATQGPAPAGGTPPPTAAALAPVPTPASAPAATNPRFKAATPTLDELKGGKVAVVVYAADKGLPEPYRRAAQTRLEELLRDNHLIVLDREKAADLGNVFKKLDDPGAFVTAEDFVKNAETLQIRALAALYLHVSVTPGLADYVSAVAHAEVRFISETDATVRAFSTVPMGVPGVPPSDGADRHAASVNAIQRAVDNAGAKMGLTVMDPATPNTVVLALAQTTWPAGAAGAAAPPKLAPATLTAMAGLARLERQTWRKEEVTGGAVAPGGGMGVVAGYIVDTDWHRKPERLYGSRLHVVDARAQRELTVLECHPVEKRAAAETGVRKVLDCQFVGSWRYVAAVTGNALFVWDVERGRLIAQAPRDKPGDAATLAVARREDGTYLLVSAGRDAPAAFRIYRQGN